MTAWAESWNRVPALLADHVQLSFAALALGMAIAVPLGVWSARSPAVARIALGFAGIIQTIPTLALLALFFPLLLALQTVLSGVSPLGFLPSLLALALYALLPILRNTATGLKGVDPAAIQAADGMGMTAAQKLRLVEGPLAAPTIMAGVRTAAVWTIGAATLATTVGQACLGDLIFAGLQTQNWGLVLAGCLAAAALAIAVDQLLGLVEHAIAARKPRRAWLALGALTTGLLLAMAGPTLASLRQSDDREIITIGAKRFGEQYILARVIGARLEAAGYEVRYKENLGSAVVFDAVATGAIDIYVDYAGTIWTNPMRRARPVPRDQMIAAINRWTRAEHDVTLIGPLGFENAYAFAVRPDDARAKSLTTLDDLARASPGMTMGTDVEFLERPEWRQVLDAYPMRFAATRAFEPTFMYRALASGEVDVITAFSSDGRIAAENFVVLGDPRGAIPAYDAILLAAPARANDATFLAAIRPLVNAIPVETMRAANLRVDRQDDPETPAAAARWLTAQIAPRTGDR